jgi:putative membrane protein insertion efficiency factor
MKQVCKAAIRLYQKVISPYTQPHCIYIPTCSAYALEAFERFGAVRGGLLACWRVLRCNPFARGGYDPVPERFTFRRLVHVYPPRPSRRVKKEKRKSGDTPS